MWKVYQKEILELLRDRKTLMFVVALPVLLFPILFLIVAFLMSNVTQEAQQRVHKYTIIGAEYASDFSKSLFYHQYFKLVPVEKLPAIKALSAQVLVSPSLSNDIKKKISTVIASGEVDMVIVIPHTEKDQNNLLQQKQWYAIFNDASALNFMYSRLNELTEKYASTIRSELLPSYQLKANEFEFLRAPVIWKKIDVSDARENLGEKLGGLIPYLLIPLCLVGATYPAIDLGAGEKERNTLETLLLTPMPRYYLVVGKFLTIVSTAIASALITIASFLFWSLSFVSVMGVSIFEEIIGSIAITDFLLILVLLIPLSAVFACILLMISIYARSFKEAQNYMGPLSFLVMLPVITATLPNIKLTWVTAAIPVTNIALAIKEILKGTVDYNFVFTIFVSTMIFAGISLWVCTYWFSREDVLFR